jgi:hypothetical protein
VIGREVEATRFQLDGGELTDSRGGRRALPPPGERMCVCGVMPDKREATVEATAVFIVPLGVCG